MSPYIIIILISLFLFYKIVLEPERKRERLLNDPLTKDLLEKSLQESILLKSKEMPTDEHIMKYYKMYCKKWEIDNRDQWTTKEPLSYAIWEKKAKTPTKITKIRGNFSLYEFGGYQYIISMTCDAMVGFPPNQIYHRYRDYEDMIKMEGEEKCIK